MMIKSEDEMQGETEEEIGLESSVHRKKDT